MTAYDWTDLVSPKVGLIRALRPQIRGADEPEPPYLWTAELAHFDFRAAPLSDRVMAGKGRSQRAAQAAAIGEAVERYCAAHWGEPAQLSSARPAELSVRAIRPDQCVLYSAEQYARADWPFPPWSPDQVITWVSGTVLGSGEAVAIPAGLTYLSGTLPRAEDAFVQATSSGLAAGASPEHALLSALCELMERDAVMITWLNRLPATELDLTGTGGIAAAIVRHYGALGVQIRCFALPTDLPATVVLALAHQDAPGRPATVVAAACHPCPEVAVEKAVFEICQARPAETARYVENPPEGRLVDYTDVRQLDDHSAFAGQRERREEFSFLWSAGGTTGVGQLPDFSCPTPKETLAACARALEGVGVEVAWTDLTTPDVRSCGFHVVRAIAAGLQPIHFGHGRERLGGDRLFELPARLGLAGARRRVADLNPCPHPMA